MGLADQSFVNDKPLLLDVLREGRSSCCGSKSTPSKLTGLKYHLFMIRGGCVCVWFCVFVCVAATLCVSSKVLDLGDSSMVG